MHSCTPLVAWFVSEPEPVYAEASKTELTAVVRMKVLPRRLLGHKLEPLRQDT